MNGTNQFVRPVRRFKLLKRVKKGRQLQTTIENYRCT